MCRASPGDATTHRAMDGASSPASGRLDTPYQMTGAVMAKTHPVVKALRDAGKGLTYPSETEAPFEAFAWPGGDGPPTAADVLAHAGLPAKTPAEEGTLADFLRAVPKATRGDYLGLVATIADHLNDVTVIKAGEVRRTAFVVGRTADGHLAGVKTELVET
ncbi:MAG: nuclease A inhibitor family protein [Gemmataceae bacterium]|nr:nuclease A inhibitor family protein [Gemmataceae bacterium]